MSEVKKRERVTRACEFCRKRKKKCDGNTPCSNCIQNKNKCQYKDAPVPRKVKKKTLPKKPSYGQKLQFIDDRLSNLESLLTKFIDSFSSEGVVSALGTKHYQVVASGREGESREQDANVSENAFGENDVEGEEDECEEDDDEEDDIDSNESDKYRSSTTSSQKLKKSTTPVSSVSSTITPINLAAQNAMFSDEDMTKNSARSAGAGAGTLASPAGSFAASGGKLSKVEAKKRKVGTAKAKPDNLLGDGDSDEIADTSGEIKNLLESAKEQDYFSNHSIFSMFSDRVLSWIETCLGPENICLVEPIRKLPIAFQVISKPTVLKWIDPPVYDFKQKQKILQGDFPEDAKFVSHLLDTYYKTFYPAYFVIDVKEIKGMFEVYYSRKSKRAAQGKTKYASIDVSGQGSPRQLKISELMIMSITLSFCMAVKLDLESPQQDAPNTNEVPQTQPNFEGDYKLSNKEIREKQQRYFKNSIYYYHMISVIGDGVSTITAILLMIIYVEASFVATHVNTLLISVAARYAQELGLDNIETYVNLSDEESQLRQRVWLLCRAMDIEIHYRSGKPPLLISSKFDSFHDIKLPINSDETTEIIPSAAGSAKEKPGLANQKNNVDTEMIRSHLLLERERIFRVFTAIRIESYSKLSLLSAQKASFEELASTLDSINKRLFEMTESATAELRPRFYYEVEFSQSLQNVGSNWISHFSYFFHLMLINSMSPNSISGGSFGSGNLDEIAMQKVYHYRDLSLDSARTLLMSVKELNCTLDKPKVVLSWNMFFSYAAFLSIMGHCMNYFNNPDCFRDVNLLIECSMNYFNHEKLSFNKSSCLDVKNKVLDLSVRLLLRILVKYLDIHSTYRFLDSYTGLKEHFAQIESLYPDLFTSGKDAGSYRAIASSAMMLQSYQGTVSPAIHPTSIASSEVRASNKPEDGFAGSQVSQFIPPSIHQGSALLQVSDPRMSAHSVQSESLHSNYQGATREIPQSNTSSIGKSPSMLNPYAPHPNAIAEQPAVHGQENLNILTPNQDQTLQEQLIHGNVEDGVPDSIFQAQVFGLQNIFFDNSKQG